MTNQNNTTDAIAAIATARGNGGVAIIRISGSSALQVLQSLFCKSPRLRPEASSGVSSAEQAAASGSPLGTDNSTDAGQSFQSKSSTVSGNTSAANLSYPDISAQEQPAHTEPHKFTPRLMEFGWVLDENSEPLDEVLAVYMPAPRSFTGEDVVEIHCHGGRAVTEAVLAAVLARGCRLAEAGEFTRRAFLNGQIDLSRAEAIAEMIAAPTVQAVHLARNKMQGRLGLELDALRQKLVQLRGALYLAIDFPDEAEDEQLGMDSTARAAFLTGLNDIKANVAGLISSFERARLWREGALVVLAGQVNAGKSSLLNALLGRKRAIVSSTPGTTRDFIEESISIEGLPVRLVDTAGLRANVSDAVEAEGMEMGRELFEEAGLILLVQDFETLDAINARLPVEQKHSASAVKEAFFDALPQEDKELVQRYGAEGAKRLLVVINKCDLAPHPLLKRPHVLTTMPQHMPMSEMYGCPCLRVSAKDGSGLEELCQAVHSFLLEQSGSLDFNHEAPPSLRQVEKLRLVLRSLESMQGEYAENIPAELLSVYLDSAAADLADIIGSANTEDVLDKVFSEFCIGK